MTKTVASIYYSQVDEVRRPSYQGYFSIKPVKRGETPFLLEIKDHSELNDLPYFAGTGSNGKPFKQRVMILGEHIADDVVAHWTKNHPDMNPQCGPGIWVVRDVIYLFDDNGKPILDAESKQAFRMATAEEKAAMFAEDRATAEARQDAWAEAAVNRAAIMADNPKAVQYIPQYCKDSADYLHLDPAWRKGIKASDMKSCPFCAKSIAATAFKCPACAEVVDATGYAEFKGRQEQAVRDVNEKLKQERLAAKTIPPPIANPQQPVAAR